MIIEDPDVFLHHPIIHMIEKHIVNNFEAYGLFLSALSIAAIMTMPPLIPKSIQDLWTWLRSSLQTAVPASRHMQEPTSPTVTDPREEPPK